MLNLFKRRKNLEKRVENLERVIPKLHKLMVKSVPDLPCKQFRECICSKCEHFDCVYNPNTTVKATSDTIINDVLHI